MYLFSFVKEIFQSKIQPAYELSKHQKKIIPIPPESLSPNGIARPPNGDIKGLDGTEDDLSLPFDLYLKQAEYFLTKDLIQGSFKQK